MTAPSIQRQAVAVARAAANLGGHVENLRTLVGKRKRPELELEMAESYLPDLEAAASTMAYLERNADRWKQFISKEAT